MGVQATKLIPGNTDDNALALQYQLINNVSKHFFVRRLVSQKRRRLLVGGYDLDMSYITNRILAMSFPAERMRAIYRNPMWQVKDVLEMRHSGHYKVYNLCIEQDYDPSHFNGLVEKFPFDDNHIPPLPMVMEFCQNVHSWLSTDPKNIAVIHCMAGKGRTGLMVSSYLVYTGMLAEEALQVYADKRTTNNLGVTIPSQRRYVHYWQKCLSYPEGCSPEVNLPKVCSRELRRIRIHDTKNIDSIFFVLSELQEISGQRYRPSTETCRNYCRNKIGFDRSDSFRIFNSFIENSFIEPDKEVKNSEQEAETEKKTCLDCSFNKTVQVTGDVCVTFYEKNIGGRLFYVCFNTAFIEDSSLKFSISELDKVGNKGKSIAGDEFYVELLFGPATYPDHSSSPPSDDGNKVLFGPATHPDHLSSPPSDDGNKLISGPATHSDHSSSPPSDDGNKVLFGPATHPDHLSSPPSDDGNKLISGPATYPNHSSSPPSDDGNKVLFGPATHPDHLSSPPSDDGNKLISGPAMHSDQSPSPPSDDGNKLISGPATHPDHSSSPPSDDGNKLLFGPATHPDHSSSPPSDNGNNSS